ncbi:MAG: hypothetical protein EOO50_13055 [Flavobacterium sp.]|uniref:DUF6928 family protein n=1 Tax=Flavobacterium sp. TaxID=239 RepID=UPI001203C7DB|nr:hypothetical protein [Flavobacterium sp.]RZJ65576.1 MAG: hypothetical protein EOO50_13055 [Flavobacterium sp.]
MGWKASFIAISDSGSKNHEQLLSGLGFSGVEKIGSKAFESVINPLKGEVYIGTYRNNLIICTHDLPMESLSMPTKLTTAESFLCDSFPTAEIGSVVLHSVVDLWGFSLVKNREKIRCFGGTSDEGIFADEGKPLMEETKFYEGPAHDHEENEFDGESITFAFCSRFLGKPLDEARDDLFDTKLQGYSYTFESDESDMLKSTLEKKSRWPFYIALIVVFLIWQIVKRTLIN